MEQKTIWLIIIIAALLLLGVIALGPFVGNAFKKAGGITAESTNLTPIPEGESCKCTCTDGTTVDRTVPIESSTLSCRMFIGGYCDNTSATITGCTTKAYSTRTRT